MHDDLKFTNIKRWLATYPSSKNIKNKHDEYMCNLKIGELGCIMSHRTLWKYVSTMFTNTKWILIFEDDITLPDIPLDDIREKMIKKIKTATYDTDIIYFGHCFYDLCTHAYAIRRTSASKLYKHTCNCKENNPKQIDIQISDLRKKGVIKCLFYDKETMTNDASLQCGGMIHQKKGSTIQ